MEEERERGWWGEKRVERWGRETGKQKWGEVETGRDSGRQREFEI